MNGGLSRVSTSHVALAAVAGLFMGGMAMPSAKAADLGGDCCADLEERVAELEATTARKGNRRMSLTVSGQVNKMVVWWDDGVDNGTVYGADNTNSSTRFLFTGKAKVTSKVSVGFEINIEHDAGQSSSSFTQWNEDGSDSLQAYNQDNPLGVRTEYWWIEHKDIGRMSVGRGYSAGVVTTIDLGGIGVIASSSHALVGGSLFLRASDGTYWGADLNSFTDPAAARGREEFVSYDSPTIAGFIFSASIGENGDQWGAMLRYAGEFLGLPGRGWHRLREHRGCEDAHWSS